MASSSGNNSYDMTAKAGWEITPYSNSNLSGAKNFDSPVQEGTQSCDGLEKGIVLAPNPLSVNLPEVVARPQPQPLLVQAQKTSRGRCLSKAKIVSVSYVSFNCFKVREDPVGYDFRMYEVGSAPEMEETMPGMNIYGHILPFPALLKNWKRETRERPSGAQDKFYFHPMCKRMLRSLVEVINFIRSNNITSNEKETNAQELQGPQRLQLSEASINRNDKKRKNNTSIVGPDSKKRRIFPVSWRTGMKTKDQSGVKEFFDDAYTNLMNLPPSTPKAAIIEEDKKLSVEAFLLDAHENLLKGFQKEETINRIHPPTTARSPSRYPNGTTPEEIDGEMMDHELSQHALQNLEPSSKTQEVAGNIVPEPPSQQGGIGNANAEDKDATMNRLTDEEMEAAKSLYQHALQNLEPSSKTQEGAGNIVPEQPSQQGEIGNANAEHKEATMNRLTDEEMEVAKNLSQHALQNLEPSSSKTQEGAGNIIPEQLSQRGGIGNADAENKEATLNRLTDEEMEVVEIFSQGLGGGGYMNHQQDVVIDYSHFLRVAIAPGLFWDK